MQNSRSTPFPPHILDYTSPLFSFEASVVGSGALLPELCSILPQRHLDTLVKRLCPRESFVCAPMKSLPALDRRKASPPLSMYESVLGAITNEKLFKTRWFNP